MTPGPRPKDESSSKRDTQPPGPATTCYRCGEEGHTANRCRFKDAKCFSCGKVGHVRAVCRSKPRDSKVKNVREEATEDEEEYSMFQVRSRSKALEVTVAVEGQEFRMEVDTGAALSIVSEDTFKQLWPDKSVQHSQIKLKTYTGEALEVVGSVEMKVRYKAQEATLPLVVVKGNGPSLFGRDWLEHIRLDWKEIHHLQGGESLQNILQRHKEVFTEELGTLQGYKAHIHVDPAVKPKFCRARTVPYARRDQVEKELERLVEADVLEPVRFAEWAAPIVPVLKTDKKSIRICGDFKATVNQAAKLEHYPIPKVEDLFSKLAGGKRFSKLDLSQAYQQILLDEDSRQYVTINTQKGLFQYKRLPFGVSSAPGIFQRTMESLVQGISGVVVYIDDVLITGPTESDHLAALEEVLSRMKGAGLRLRRDKCAFLERSVVYLGYRIDEEGLHPVHDKVKAVQQAPAPKSVSQLKAYLGLLTYYSRFLPHLPSVLAPLYERLKKGKQWQWGASEEQAFQQSKKLLTSESVLVHFDPKKELVLACDASAVGVGAVLAHKYLDGSEKPIGFVSRTLTETEQKYSQIEKEGLACVFGVKRFHAYLHGHPFQLITDHQPLVTLFSEKKAISPQASARIQRWALTLANYEYTMKFRPTEKHGNADALSRCPLPETPQATPVPAELVLLVEQLENAPVTAKQIQTWTRADSLLARVREHVEQGWPSACPQEELRSFWVKRTELSVQEGCVLWGSRIVVPSRGRSVLLQELHVGHPGIARMRSVARSCMWWPGIDNDIDALVKKCHSCQQNQKSPPSAPLFPWSWPTRPWSRVHIDYAGPVFNHMFLVVIDAHSKWIEAFPMKSTTSQATIQRLRTLFAQFGIPNTLVSDNGPNFTSAEFAEFLKRNGITHIQTAPYHPSSNGLAERAVQVVKQGLRKNREGIITDRLARVLFSYRTTAQSTTGRTPAELLFGRNLRTRFDLLKPDVTVRVENQQMKQKARHDERAEERCFQAGEHVFVKNFRPGDPWLRGQVVSCVGPVSFRVKLNSGAVLRRHQDHVRKRLQDPVTELGLFSDVCVPGHAQPDETGSAEQPPTMSVSESVPAAEQHLPTPASPELRRYPLRVRLPPQRYSESLKTL